MNVAPPHHDMQVFRLYANYGIRLVTNNRSVSQALQAVGSIHLRKESTGLPYSCQLFLDGKRKINIVIHPSPGLVIESGSYKKIQEAVQLNLHDGTVAPRIAAKPIFKPSRSEYLQLKTMKDEIDILNLLQGKRGICRIIDWVYYLGKNGRPKLNIVMERADCDLHTALYRREFSLTATKVMDLAHALFFAIHVKGYVHGDIKLENILVFGNRLKLTDFGALRTAENPEFIGTPYYKSPGTYRCLELSLELRKCTSEKENRRYLREFKELKPVVGQACDVYALGMVLYACSEKTDVPWREKIDPRLLRTDLDEMIKICQYNQNTVQVSYRQLLKQHPPESRSPLLQLIFEMLNPNDLTRIKSYRVLRRLQAIYGRDA